MRTRSEIGKCLSSLGLVGLGVEVGVFRGEFAETILKTWPGKLILVDPWRHLSNYFDSWNLSDTEMERNFHITLDRMRAFNGRASILRECSLSAVTKIADESCDFIYIDANHAYAQVHQDLRVWFPKLRRGGLMSGHDYFDALADEALEPRRDCLTEIPKENLSSYGVKSAVDEFVSELDVTLSITDERLPTWFFVKP